MRLCSYGQSMLSIIQFYALFVNKRLPAFALKSLFEIIYR